MFSHYISFTETETTRGIAWYTIGIEKSRPRYTVGNVRKHDVPSVYLLLLILLYLKSYSMTITYLVNVYRF